MTEREQFEAWARPFLDVRISLADGNYANFSTEAAWQAWQAARAAITFEKHSAAAPAEPTRSAEPVAWMHVYKKATGGAAYSQADIGEHGPDPEPGFVHVGKDPLYAHPPRSAEWVAEAMRLFDQAVVDAWNAGEEGRDYIADVRAARAALEAHLTSSS